MASANISDNTVHFTRKGITYTDTKLHHKIWDNTEELAAFEEVRLDKVLLQKIRNKVRHHERGMQAHESNSKEG
jgi:hypothetical protein